MNSIELLKQELADQKSAIETKGGTVSIANTNVSPSEITAGIKSIPVVDLSQGTATEADVLLGKTFYAGNDTLKIGSLIQNNNSGGTPGDSSSDEYKNLVEHVLYGKPSDSYPNLEIHIPEYVTKIKDYTFNSCQCKCDIYLNSALTEVGSYAFYQSADITIHNLEKASNLVTIGTNSFREAKGIELSALPSSLQSVGNYGFCDCAKYSNSIVLPQSLTTLGTYSFACTEITPIQSIDLSKLTIFSYPLYIFQYIKCLSNLDIPEGVDTVNSYFNYCGSIKSVVFPSTLTRISSYAFNVKDTVPLEDLITESYTFLSQAPPSITSTGLCTRLLDRTNISLKIYVPDESVDSYKATTSFRSFANYIFPHSQKT